MKERKVVEYDDNDYELLYLIKEENEEAKNKLYEKYRPIVEIKTSKYYSFIQNKGYDMNDLFQEGMMGLTNAINDYKDQKKVSFKTFANICIDRNISTFIRNINRQKHQILNTSVSIDSPNDSSGRVLLDVLSDTTNINPEDSFINMESYDELKRIVSKDLTEKEKNVFELRLKGFSYDEIARLLNITKRSVDGAIRRIKIKISNINENK